MGDTWLQIRNKSLQRLRDKTSSPKGPYMGVIASVSSTSETTSVEHSRGLQNMRVLHPYLGKKSWIRAMPETGMTTLLFNRFDTYEPEVISYYNEGTMSPSRIDAYNSESPTEPYRPLEIGEIHLKSSGDAELYMGRRSLFKINCGPIKSWWSLDHLQSGTRSPLHIKEFSLHKTDTTINDEERVGIVIRNPDDIITDKIITDSTNPTKFLKEYLLNLKNDSTTTLIDFRCGDVIDDSGNPMKHSITNNNLLSRIYHNPTQGDEILYEMDVKGNVKFKAPESASTGLEIEYPKGTFKVTFGDNLEFNITNKSTLKSSDILLDASSSTVLKCNDIKLGDENAEDYVIKGKTYRNSESSLHDQLKSNLNSLVTNLNVIGTLFTSAGSLQTTPVYGAVASAPLLSQIGSTFLQCVPLLTSCITAISTFEGKAKTYESVTTKVK